MSRRYFSAEPIRSRTAKLQGPEAHHLLHVSRVRPGDRVTLFDGQGGEFDAQVTQCSRKEVLFDVADRIPVERELDFPLEVGVAWPKGERARLVVEKMTELGVTALTPLLTKRSQLRPGDGDPAKLSRYVIEASKQCGRNTLMEVREFTDWQIWLTGRTTARRLAAHPGGRPIGDFELAQPLPTSLAIGPEGGLTDEEAEAALVAGWQLVDLGARILRVETAAVALVSAIALGTHRSDGRQP